jgi:hypothetical protein
MPSAEYEMPEEGMHDGWLEGWNGPQVSKYQNKDGSDFDIIQLVYRLDEDMANGQPFMVSTKWFPFHFPHKVLVENQNALAGREVADDEEFDFAEYVGKKVRVNILHSIPNDEGKVYANIAKVSAAKAAKPKAKVVVEDFPDDDSSEDE